MIYEKLNIATENNEVQSIMGFLIASMTPV